MRVAVYGRVSTGHQVEHQTIEQQLGRLTAHVRAHAAEGWALDPAHVFRDDGYSGAVLARPGLDRLRDAVKGREIDRVLVTAPDRLARNYVHQMVLLEEWARAGCAAEFLDRPMSDDPHDHLLLQIRGAVAEYERTLIAERMRRGRLAKLRAGVLLPWTCPPYGYRVSPDRPRDPKGVTTDPAEAAVVAELFAMYREPGTSLARLALQLDRRGVPTPSGAPRWSSPTIRGILRNPAYTGQVYALRTRYRAPTHRRSATHPIGRPHGTAVPQPADAWLLVGQVPAVVSQAHFDEVQAKLATNRSFARRNNTDAPVPAARAGELRVLRPRLHGAGDRRAQLLLPVRRQGAQHLLAPRHTLRRALHPGRPARRPGVAGLVRAAGRAGAARLGGGARPRRGMAAAGAARPPRDAAPRPGAPAPAARAAHRRLPPGGHPPRRVRAAPAGPGAA